MVVAVSLALLIQAIFFSPKTHFVQITEQVKGEFKEKVDDFKKDNARLTFADAKSPPDIIIDTQGKEGFEASLIREVPPLVVKAGDKEVVVRKAEGYYLLYKKKDGLITELEEHLKQDLPEISMTACGDIIPGRHVAEKMAEKGVNYPFEKIAPHVKGADIVYGNLECPLSDRYEPPYSGIDFVAPSETIKGINLCGFNLFSLANNHITDFGPKVFSDTLELLKANNIQYVGGGMDHQEAHTPLFMDVKGIRFAFLNYDGVIRAVFATEERPGVAGIRLWPSFDDDPDDVVMVENAIREVRKEADVVVVFFHWGREYEYKPVKSVVRLAHAACDAGADLIIGTHPHSIQSVEYYDGKLIAYSLGNFVFDQVFSDQVREGVIMKCKFRGKTLSEVEFMPYKIRDYCQPNLLEDGSGQYLLDRLLEISSLGE